jgi:hypothetical protein
MSSSEEEEIVIVCLLNGENKTRKEGRRIWMHKNICKKSVIHGEFHYTCICPDLLADKEFFYYYYRVNYEKFMTLLGMLVLVHDLSRQNTSLRQATGLKEGLSLCLS